MLIRFLVPLCITDHTKTIDPAQDSWWTLLRRPSRHTASVSGTLSSSGDDNFMFSTAASNSPPPPSGHWGFVSNSPGQDYNDPSPHALSFPANINSDMPTQFSFNNYKSQPQTASAGKHGATWAHDDGTQVFGIPNSGSSSSQPDD